MLEVDEEREENEEKKRNGKKKKKKKRIKKEYLNKMGKNRVLGCWVCCKMV